jgi:hypothetical protein
MTSGLASSLISLTVLLRAVAREVGVAGTSLRALGVGCV